MNRSKRSWCRLVRQVIRLRAREDEMMDAAEDMSLADGMFGIPALTDFLYTAMLFFSRETNAECINMCDVVIQ